MSIRQLPEDVVAKIKSSAAITSLNGVVCGLLQNSLDAGATKISISVDYGRGNCTVEDNGPGIGPGEFAEDGGLGKPYYTSKLPSFNLSTHGRHGSFLASLAVLSLLTVTSHHCRHNSHNSISIHHGKVLRTPGERFESFDHGTRVAVHDLFGSMPVRVKHRATLFSDRSGLDKEWACLIRHVAGLLLAWQSDVSVCLRETKGERELRLKTPEDADIIARTSRLFIQASLADSGDADSWVPVSASSGRVTLKGCISVNPVATRQSQFMSLGVSPIPNDYGNNVLFEEVNKVFKSSSFGVIEGEDDDMRSGNMTAETRSKLRKGIDRWPMFYFRILLQGADGVFDMDDVLSRSRRDLEGILDLLKAASYGFLKKHHMRPQKIQVASNKSAFSTATTTRRSSRASKGRLGSSNASAARSLTSGVAPTDLASVRSDSPFDSWNRVKVGLRTDSGFPKRAEPQELKSGEGHEAEVRRLIGERGKLLRKPFEDAVLSEATVCHEDSRASVVASARTTEDYLQTNGKTVCEGQAKAQPSEWLQSVLWSWNNPVFEPAQASLPRIHDESGAPRRDPGTRHGLHQCSADEDGGVRFEAASISLHGRVSRAALSEAEVISQVDRKFILMKLPLCSMKPDEEMKASSALVMLDQHAADERCRLEGLMAGYFKDYADGTGLLKAIVETLERPLMFEVSGREGDLLRQFQDRFEAWGIIYKLPPRTKDRDSCTVAVKALPPSILERCRGEPRVLVELMRKEVWHLNDEGSIPPQPRASGGAYTANFHGCPRGILELLHSRSCRSAIMFNDVLSKQECEQLVRRLARCAFPFQCAHGRPSMAPLVDLGSACRIGGWDESDSNGGDGAWKRWMKR